MAVTEIEVYVQSVAPTVVTPTYVPVEVVVQGPQGIKGDSGTVTIGTTTTGAAGTPATVTNTGTPQDSILNFKVPQGIQGIQGVKGDTGTLALGTVTTGAAGTNALITNTGTPSNGIFNFTIPKGDKGDTGTMSLGTVTTGAPGSNVAITNTGTPTNGIFNFTIPRGDVGATGTMSLGTVTTGAAGTSVIITNTGTPTAGVFNFTIPQGIQGIPGSKWYAGVGAPATGSYVIGDWYLNTTTQDVYEKTGAAVWTLRTNIKGATGTMSIGTVSTGAAGSSVIITNTGTPTAGVFNFTIPQGIQGVQGPTGATGLTGPQGIQGIQGIQGPSGTISLGTVTTGAVGSNVVITNSGTSAAAVFNFTLPRGAGVQVGGTTGQYLRKNSATDFDTSWVDIPAPLNMETTDTAQTITGAKTFTVGPSVPANSWSIANTSGLQAALDAKYSAANPQPIDFSPYVTLASTQTITGAKTFTGALVVPDGSWTIADTNGLQTALNAKYQSGAAPLFGATDVQGILTIGTNTVGTTNQIVFRDPGVGGTQQFVFSRATDSAGMKVTEAVGDQILYQFYMADNPDGGDYFSWYFTDYAGGNWEPLSIGGLQNTYRASIHNFWGNITQQTSSWYSGGAGVPNTVTKLGTGTLTITPGVGGYVGTTGNYWAKIDGVGTPNTFQWGTGQPGTNIVASLVPITGAAQTLNNGVTITFSATTGGVIGDTYNFRVSSGGIANLGRVVATQVFEGANRVYSATTGMATTVVSETGYAQAAAVGTGILWARNDHTHGTPASQVITGGTGITATPSGANYTIANTGVLTVTASGNLASSGGQNPAITMVASPTFTNVTATGNVTVTGSVTAASVYEGAARMASQTYVDTAINNLISSAPGTMNTLNELATALGNDPNFAATMTANINTRALDNTVVHLAGSETITGTKTFSATTIHSGPVQLQTAAGYLTFVSNPPASATGGFLEYFPGADATNRLNITGASSINLATFQVWANATVFTGTVNSNGTLSENGNRVYSAAYAPPYPVTTVAGRTGAVVLSNTDIANSMDVNTAQTVTGTKTFTAPVYAQARLRAGFNGQVGANTALVTSAAEFELSVQSLITIGESAAGDGNPAITLYRTYGGYRQGTGLRMVYKSSAGPFAWQTGGTSNNSTNSPSYGTETYSDIMTLSNAGALNTIGTLSEAGNRVYSAGNPPPYPVTTVAGRTGAIVLTNTDIANSMDLNTTQSVTGVKTFTQYTGALGFYSTNDGTAALPAFRFGNTAANNTGMYSPATDQLALSSAGTQRLLVTTTGVTVTGTLFEGANRVYSAGYAPPYPVTTVAGRTGAVVLVPTDIAAGTFTGAFGFSSQLQLAAGLNVTQANGGLEIGASAANTPFIDFHSGATYVDYDARIIASGGTGVVGGGTLTVNAATVTVSNNLNASGTLTEAGSRVYTAANAPVQGIPFHVGGTVGVGLKAPKFIAPANMTLRTARAWADTMAASGVSFQIYVNGAAVSGAAYTMVAAATQYLYDFPDVNIVAGDRVQLYVATADATATELSVTVEAVTR